MHKFHDFLRSPTVTYLLCYFGYTNADDIIGSFCHVILSYVLEGLSHVAKLLKSRQDNFTVNGWRVLTETTGISAIPSSWNAPHNFSVSQNIQKT